MKLSHSKLQCILNCPMTYYLQYRMGITPKTTKAALSIGSAVHWGLEHNTEDLSGYYKSEFISDEQALAEAMVHGFLVNKLHIFDEILRHPITGEKLTLVDETHELFITGKLKSFLEEVQYHDFVGIIDLLLLVQDKDGNLYFIVIDYKTSSFSPTWEEYLDQIYRYLFLLNSYIPEVPVLKTGIINLKKSKFKKKVNENNNQYALRLKKEYEIDDGTYLCWHMYDTDTLNKQVVDDYIRNLSRECDTAHIIDTNNTWFINYAGAVNKYGKSQYWDIFYRTPSCHVLYNITDHIYNEETETYDDIRDCRPLDMKVIDNNNVLNKYESFKLQAFAFYSINEEIDKSAFFADLKKRFITDDVLLDKYWTTLMHDLQEEAAKA